MRIIVLPILSDNYSYLVIDKHGTAVSIDPADPEKVLWATQQQRARLAAVLTTHRHSDHAGGNKKLAQHLPDLEIVGGADDAVPACTRLISSHQELLEVGNLEITCLRTPYHTAGHICYLILEKGAPGPQALFSGDVLFVGGCGRRFQGSTEEMYHTLITVLADLPPDTLVYCGHEYTVANLEFAATVEEANPAIKKKLEWARERRASGKATVPSTIGEELDHNVFLRCHHLSVQHYCGTAPVREGVMPMDSENATEECTAWPECSPAQLQMGLSSDHIVCMSTLVELRRRKDAHGVMATIMTVILKIGGLFGWTP